MGKNKIYEHNNQDLAIAFAAVERLLNFVGEAGFQRKHTSSQNIENKPFKPMG